MFGTPNVIASDRVRRLYYVSGEPHHLTTSIPDILNIRYNFQKSKSKMDACGNFNADKKRCAALFDGPFVTSSRFSLTLTGMFHKFYPTIKPLLEGIKMSEELSKAIESLQEELKKILQRASEIKKTINQLSVLNGGVAPFSDTEFSTVSGVVSIRPDQF